MKIIMATGGSGGHLFPAIKVAQVLRQDGHEVLFAGSFNSQKNQQHFGQRQIMDEAFGFENIYARGLNRRGILEWIRFLWFMVKAHVASIRLLRKFDPDAVCGFGGYGAFPVVLSACLLKRPTLIHEQNVIPGRANAILAKWVPKIAVSFQQSIAYFGKTKTVLTGCPSHASGREKNKNEIIKGFCLQEGRQTILIMGGSQGSHQINEVFMQAIEELQKNIQFQVIHITGDKDYPLVKEAYQHGSVPHSIHKFLDRIEEAYAIADLVISRAGAVTVTEIAMYHLPVIFIPFPFAGGHQKENAKVLLGRPQVRIIEESQLTSSQLNTAITEILNRPFRENVSDSLQDNIYIPDAANRIARELLELIK